MCITLEFLTKHLTRENCVAFRRFLLFHSTSHLEEITNSHPRGSSVRNLVCAVLDGALTIEGHWLKAILKRGSLNNTINLMSFAGQSGEGGKRILFTRRLSLVKLPLVSGAYFRPSISFANHNTKIRDGCLAASFATCR